MISDKNRRRVEEVTAALLAWPSLELVLLVSDMVRGHATANTRSSARQQPGDETGKGGGRG